jgi:hypothetical protein
MPDEKEYGFFLPSCTPPLSPFTTHTHGHRPCKLTTKTLLYFLRPYIMYIRFLEPLTGLNDPSQLVSAVFVFFDSEPGYILLAEIGDTNTGENGRSFACEERTTCSTARA